MKVTLIRHATTLWNEQARYQGWTDVPLSATGIEEARVLAERRLPHSVDAVVSSDLGRCLETARIIFPNHVIRTTPELRELSFGVWEGLTYQECLDRDPEVYRHWLDDPSTMTPPDGERLKDFETRIQRVFDALIAEHSNDDQMHLAVVTHGGPIRYLLRRGVPTSNLSTQGDVSHIAPCGVIHLCISPHAVTITSLE